ncbi:xylose isomerase-like protein [Meredithblackwellia eburnea MCA 4105]
MSLTGQVGPCGIVTRSLGRSPAHYLPEVLQACANSGLRAIELSYECLEAYSKRNSNYNSDPRSTTIEIAHQINKLAHSLGISFVALDAFDGYEGLKDRQKHSLLIEKFKFWTELCQILGIQLILVPASFSSEEDVTGDADVISSDLRELCDIGLLVSPPIKIAYEALPWSTFVSSWERALEVCKQVGRPNIGVCLDTFHIVSLLWGSPTTENGRREEGEHRLKESLDRLRKVNAEDILLYQLSDGELLSPPMPTSRITNLSLPPVSAWSKRGRPYPGEGYFPVNDVTEAILSTGFRGPIVHEVFQDDAYDTSPGALERHGERAVKSWEGIVGSLGLNLS